ncbi:MAG: Gfo/Idh/MocA family oxidoreductase, partial [Pirellula sp.]|nr:Gfo/Idh/MocA family oxidoreductase [Pirellula sp.]
MNVRMDLSRRDFVERAILAATAALAAGSMSQNSNALEPTPIRRVGPNDKLRVATIGVNGQGGGHLSEWLQLPDVEVVAICDCDPAAYKKVIGKFKDAKTQPTYVQDVRKLLEDKSIDAVSIATPNHWHA